MNTDQSSLPASGGSCDCETFKQLVRALDGLVQECEYSASSGLPFNYPEGLGRWTQLEKAKALLATLPPISPTVGRVKL